MAATSAVPMMTPGSCCVWSNSVTALQRNGVMLVPLIMQTLAFLSQKGCAAARHTLAVHTAVAAQEDG